MTDSLNLFTKRFDFKNNFVNLEKLISSYRRVRAEKSEQLLDHIEFCDSLSLLLLLQYWTNLGFVFVKK